MHSRTIATRLGAGILFLVAAGCGRLSSARMPWSHPATGPSDANIAAFMLAADNTDISYAKLVPARAESPAVRDFAARMLTDHQAVDAAMRELMDRISLTPEENSMSLGFRDESSARRDLMRGLAGRAFDSTYIANEVAYHTRLLDALDRVLIPGAKSPQLRQTLVSVRPAVIAHLGHAERVQTALRQR